MDFRALTRADFPLLRAWLDEPLIRRWWNHETTPQALERDFGPSLDGDDPTECFVAVDGGVPFGLIQRYSWGPHPEYLAEIAPAYRVDPAALGVDYLIGDPARRGRGLGAAMIAALVARSWAEYPEAPEVVVPVALGNTASWRALERAGFRRVATAQLAPDNPVDPPDHVVYAIPRPG